MSETQAIGSTTAAATNAFANTRASTPSTVDYDAFLQLLVAQMQNQDPTKPMDSTEYMAQLASFSNVEQAIQTNEKLDQILSSSLTAGAGSLIGKTATNADGSVSGEIVEVSIRSGAMTAVLQSGDQISINNQVTISK
ncbi:MAG: flagellar hook assembly protein FlgD [Pseudomonadota bacterium]